MRFPTYILLLSANVVLVRRPVVASSPGNGPGKYIDPYPRSLSDEKITSPVGSTLEREVDNVKLKMPEDEPGRATSRKALPTEVEKLHRQRGHPGPANRKWAQCMDECLPEVSLMAMAFRQRTSRLTPLFPCAAGSHRGRRHGGSLALATRHALPPLQLEALCRP